MRALRLVLSWLYAIAGIAFLWTGYSTFARPRDVSVAPGWRLASGVLNLAVGLVLGTGWLC